MNDDLKMMQDPNLWPAWPRLPMKRYPDGPMETGVLIENMAAYEYLWMPGVSALEHISGEMIRREAIRFRRDNVAKLQEILDDGWMID